jgi:hypothetical protein
MNEDQFKNWLIHRFSLKGHMTAILACTSLSGVFLSFILHAFGWNAMAIRYPVSVLFSYAIFFLLVKIWLRVIFPAHEESKGFQGGHVYNSHYWPWFNFGGTSSSTTEIPQFQGGGGRSGGGGASGSWSTDGAPQSVAAVAMAPSSVSAAGPTGGGLSGLSDIKLPTSGKDGGGLIILIIGGLVIAAIFGSAIYLIVSSSQILTETAFQFAMSAGLVRSAKRAVSGSWERTTFHETWIPFTVVLILSLTFGIVAQKLYPDATTMKEVWLAATDSSKVSPFERQ